jgi:uncharacterized protein DUF1236
MNTAMKLAVAPVAALAPPLILAILLAGLPVAAHAQNAPAREGERAGGSVGGAVGSVGGAVGGAVGAVVGAPVDAAAGLVGGLTGANAPRFRHYVVEEHIPSYVWPNHPRVVVGDVLPAQGVTLYPVPPEYGVTTYEYTVVDNEPVLVDPSTRRVVEIIQ